MQRLVEELEMDLKLVLVKELVVKLAGSKLN